MVSKVSDERVTLMTEVLSNIRLIKMYAWEDSFAKNLESEYDFCLRHTGSVL